MTFAPTLGIYEKALPTALAWPRFFTLAKRSGYDFVEIAVDECPARIARLDWPAAERAAVRRFAAEAGVTIGTVTLSAHRAVPLGSSNPDVRRRARQMTLQAIALASDLGAKCVQIAGYFTYYEPSHVDGRRWFLDGMADASVSAESAGVVLAVENVDGSDVTCVADGLSIVADLGSPSVQLYVDVGNLAGNDRDVAAELRAALPHTFAVQFKDARPGEFRRVSFGSGSVPWDDVVRTLQQADYRGPIALEMWNDEGDPELAADAAQWFSDLTNRVASVSRPSAGSPALDEAHETHVTSAATTTMTSNATSAPGMTKRR